MSEWNGDEDTAVGGVNATQSTVLEYLTHPKGGKLPEAQARELMTKHAEEVSKGVRFGSFANYVGDVILQREGLPEGSGE